MKISEFLVINVTKLYNQVSPYYKNPGKSRERSPESTGEAPGVRDVDSSLSKSSRLSHNIVRKRQIFWTIEFIVLLYLLL